MWAIPQTKSQSHDCHMVIRPGCLVYVAQGLNELRSDIKLALTQKGHQYLFCLRQLTSFPTAKTILLNFYSEYKFGFSSMVSWYVLKDRNKLMHIVDSLGKLISKLKLDAESLCSRRLQRISSSILNPIPYTRNFCFFPPNRVCSPNVQNKTSQKHLCFGCYCSLEQAQENVYIIIYLS